MSRFVSSGVLAGRGGRQRSRSAPYVGVARNYGGLLGGGSLMKPSACGLRLAVVNDVWDNGVTDVVGVIGQGVIMLHHACVRVRYNGTMLMPSGPCAPRPRLPPITVGSQALQSTLSIIGCEPPSRDANSFIYHTCSVWVSVHLLPRAEGGTTMHSVSLDRSDRVLEYFSLGIASDCRLAP